jgi:bifunctional polynucleotide phosphatase/kinase
MKVTTNEDFTIIDNGFLKDDNDKIASFDLDHTIIKPKNGRTFTIKHDSNDWEFFHPNVIPVLNHYNKNGYKIIIISNQGGLQGVELNVWINKVINILTQIGLPIIVYGITKKESLYRKPLPNIWSEYVNGSNESFYCGDACGLPKRVVNKIKLPKDFADTDVKFALNCGIKFYSRDELILNRNEGSFYNITYPIINKAIAPVNLNINNLQSSHLVILVGAQGSGKSSFAKKYFGNYKYINNDTLVSKKVKDAALTDAFNNNNCIIIDNTNPKKMTRKTYIDTAIKKKYKITCYYISTSIDISKHNNYYRYYVSNGNVARVPTLAYNIYKKNLEMPTVDEGINEVINIDFVNSNIDNKYYYYYY